MVVSHHNSRNSPATRQEGVEILVGDLAAVVNVEAWLMGESVERVLTTLRYSAREFLAAGPLGHQGEVNEFSLTELDLWNRVGFPLGLLPRVIHELNAAGVPVTVTDTRDFGSNSKPPPEPRLPEPPLPTWLETVIRESRGQIEVRGEKSLIARMAQIIRLFPTTRVLVLAASNRRLRDLRRKLGNALGRRIARSRGWSLPDGPCVAVGLFTFYYPRQADLILLPDPEQCLGRMAIQSIVHLMDRRFRLYGFPRAGRRLGAGVELQIEALIGPVIVPAGVERADVKVLVCRSRSFPADLKSKGLERKRQAVWLHDGRNDLIAEVATSFAIKAIDQLQRHGLLLDPADADWLAALTRPKIAILVESTEHAKQLQRRLPGWGMKTCLPEDIDNPDRGRSPGMIVTMTYAAGHRTHPDVLIRADGGTSLPPLKGFPPAKHSRSSGRVLLIDIDDDIDRVSRRNLLSRLRTCRHQRWQMDEAATDLILKSDLTSPEAGRHHSEHHCPRRPKAPHTAGSRADATGLTPEINPPAREHHRNASDSMPEATAGSLAVLDPHGSEPTSLSPTDHMESVVPAVLPDTHHTKGNGTVSPEEQRTERSDDTD